MSLPGPPAKFLSPAKKGLVIGVTQSRFADVELLTFLTPTGPHAIPGGPNRLSTVLPNGGFRLSREL
jgi:hypothetical protein